MGLNFSILSLHNGPLGLILNIYFEKIIQYLALVCLLSFESSLIFHVTCFTQHKALSVLEGKPLCISFVSYAFALYGTSLCSKYFVFY